MAAPGQETTSSEGEEQEPGCFDSFPRQLVEYQTQKRVVIRSPWLQLPNVCAQVIIALYIIFIQLLFNLRFMETESPDITAVGQLQKPISNWDVCHDEDFDCMMDVPITPPSYCSGGTFGPSHTMGLPADQTRRRVERCWRNDVHEDPSTSFLIPTMISFIDQTWTNGSVDWHNDNVEEYYMENIEEFHIRLFHSFIAPGIGLNASSYTSQGYLTGTHLLDPLQAIPCEDTETYTCPSRGLAADNASVPACGIADANGHGLVCVSTQWGDVISVATLLNAVLPGVQSEHTLDMPRPLLDNFTYRQSGFNIRIQISYENLDSYWHEFFHVGASRWTTPTPIYKVHVRPVMAQRSRVISHTEILRVVNQTTGRVDPFRRTLRRHTGLWVTISTSGHVGKASIRQLLLSITTALALLKLANMLVDHILVKIYWKTKGFFHVSILADMHVMDRSAACHQFKERLPEEQLELLRSQGKLNDEDVSRLKHMEFKNEEMELSSRRDNP